MTGWFKRWRERRVWRYVGTVEAMTILVDEAGKEISGGERRGYWILSERGDGKRRSEALGNAGHSPAAEQVRAAIAAWAAGGPVPEFSSEEEPEPQPKGTADLIVFPGGKKEAAP